MKTIEEAAKEYEDKEPDVISGDYTSLSVINAFKAGVEFAQRWIPVEEEMPKNGDFVLVEYRGCGFRKNYIVTFAIDGKFHLNGTATRWRLLELK